VEALVDAIPCALYGYARWPDGTNRFVYISAQCEEIFGHPPERVVREPELLWGMVHPDDRERLEREDEASNRSGQPFRSEVRIVMPSGQVKWIQLASMPSPQLFQGQVLWSGVILDITERKRAEEEKSRLLEELREALSRIRKLEGIIPICSFCKKIRADDGKWDQVDVYIRRHSDTDFSHGICPDCQAEHYPDV
jgi:PAS domain S-box-containing protein